MTTRRGTPGDGAPHSPQRPLPGSPQRPLPDSLRSLSTPVLTESRRDAIGKLVQEIADGESVRRLLVFGPTGVGKTSVLITVARALHDSGHDIAYCVGQGADGGAHSSALAAVPELSPILSPFGGTDPQRPSAAMVAAWHRAGLALEGLNPGRRMALVIDEAQRLDRHSAGFIEFIETSPSSTRLSLILSAVDPDQLTVQLRRSLLRSDARYLMLEAMDRHDVADVVTRHFRDSTAPARRALVADLLRRSDGLPAVLEALLPMVNPNTFTINDPEPPGRDAIESSIASANRFVIEGEHREAVERLTALSQIEGLRLNTETRTLLATSLYQMGALAEADRVRMSLVNEALMADDHDVAFAAASIGLPNAEVVDGDADRLHGLLGIHVERLAPAVRLQHAVVTSREALHASRMDLTFYWMQQAERFAKSADDRAAIAHVAWHLWTLDDLPEERVMRLTGLLGETGLSPMWQALLHELRAIDHYESGRRQEAEDDYEVLGDYAEAAGDPRRLWHHLMFKTMILFDAGLWKQAEEVRAKAMAFAVQNTIIGGEGLYVAQHFHQTWLLGQHGALVDKLRDIPPEIRKTRFGEAGWVESLRSAGRLDSAVKFGAPLVERLLSGRQYASAALVALLARFIAQTGSAETVDKAVKLLSRRPGTAIMVGAGVSSFGPVDRYLFHLTGDSAHLDNAIGFADRADYRLWRVLLRVEHPDYEVDGPGLMSRQARILAAGTELEAMLTMPRVTHIEH